MKKKFYFFILFSFIVFFNLFKIFFGGEKFCIDKKCRYLKNNFNVYYKIVLGKGPDSDSKIYRIPSANPKTFEILKGDYSKDEKNVFSCHLFVPDIFRVIGKCKKIDKADVSTFKVLEYDTFAKDKNNVFCNGNITKFDTNSFKELSYHYFKDKNNVYYADNTYYCDKQDIFKEIKDVDIKSFEIVKFYRDKEISCSSSAKDQNNFYYYGKKIDNFDPNTLKILTSNCFYFKDKNNVYYGEKIINNVDVETFEFLVSNPNTYNEYFFLDKNNCYKVIGDEIEKIGMSECKKVENFKT